MSEPLPTLEAIRTMDGPALCRLALSLGLAPEGTEVWDDMPDSMLYAFFQREPWEPHVTLRQADAVFRGLRARGWDTFQGYDAQYQFGWVTAFKARSNATWECQWRMTAPEEERMALLRVSVLAVASEAAP